MRILKSNNLNSYITDTITSPVGISTSGLRPVKRLRKPVISNSI